MLIDWSQHLEVKPAFTFYSRRIGLRWSARGFPDLLTRHMLFEGMYQQDVLIAIKSLVHPGDTVIDVGGHHGLMAITASRAVGSAGLVVSFEPNPHARARFLENCALNGANNIRLEPCALGDEPGALKFYVQKGTVSWNSSLFADFASQGGRDTTEQIDVAVTTIDAYVSANGLNPAFVKIDAEGSEFLILKGAMRTIRQHRPVISMEFNRESATAAHTTIDAHRELLDNLGYRLIVLRRSPMGFFRLKDQEPFDPERHAVQDLCNVLCVPPART